MIEMVLPIGTLREFTHLVIAPILYEGNIENSSMHYLKWRQENCDGTCLAADPRIFWYEYVAFSLLGVPTSVGYLKSGQCWERATYRVHD